MKGLVVEQRERLSDEQFWYVVRSPNGKNEVRSYPYDSRAHAIRAAKAFIASIAPVPVRFTFWFGGQGRSEPQQLTVSIRPVAS